ncbi:hypothetical protein [Aminipila terrae]|uniref:Uncharacterized protein n=1 Tax=Aminipila terrae TaxID=2697030 RepID=A0A6P1MLC1_9FIRM|nr:hypothetical protein [Aminipila terrae]QHI71775.1 hypothetical protein Ami3637_04675 [Aminipila terrae]
MQIDEIKVSESDSENLMMREKLLEIPEMSRNEESLQRQIKKFNVTD